MVYTSAQVDWKFDLWNRFLPSSMHPKSLILALYSLNTHTQEPASSLEYEFGNIGNYFFLCDFLSKKRSYLWRYKGSYFRKLIRKRQGWTTTKTENKKKTFRTDKTPNQKIFPPIKWRRNYSYNDLDKDTKSALEQNGTLGGDGLLEVYQCQFPMLWRKRDKSLIAEKALCELISNTCAHFIEIITSINWERKERLHWK